MNEISFEYDLIRKFESNNELLDFRLAYGDIPIWPLVRNQVIVNSINLKKGICSNFKKEKFYGSRNIFQEMTYRNPYFSLHKDIVYVGFPSSNFAKHKDGMIYDERIKAYVDVFANSSMIISITDNDELKYGYKNWKTDYAISKFAVNRRYQNNSKKDAQTLKKFVRYLEDKCPIEMTDRIKKVICNVVMSFSERLEGYVNAWKTYLKIVRPKLIIEYCGCFMGLSNVAMNLACESLHVPTAEIQVSWIGKNYHSYYCGTAIKESRVCQKIYPDYYLTWGRYWESFVNNPCKAVTIGTHRNYQYVSERNNNILICWSVTYELGLQYVDYIMNHISPESKIYLRLHPKENTAKVRNIFKKYKSDNRFHFANEKDLMDYMNQCTYMIADGSTVVYEALACGKIIFVSRDELYDMYRLEDIERRIYSFGSLEEFGKLWESRGLMQIKQYDDFFDMNYKKRFKKFVRDIVNRNS